MTFTVLATPAALDDRDLVIEGAAYHHLFHAARVASGDPVRVVDGRGRARHGAVVEVDRRRAVVRLGAAAPTREPRLRLELLVAAPRPSRASWLVEKGTELGVRAFRFLDCERALRTPDRAGLDRLRRVARAAVEQCGRSWLPEVTAPHRLEEALQGLEGGPAVVLDPAASEGPRWPAGCGAAPGSGEAQDPLPPLLLVVGPEGGLTAAELAAAARLGAGAMRLVPSTLRVETAALAAASWLLLQAETASRPL